MSALRDQVKMWAGQFIKTAKLSSWGQKWGTVNIAGAAVDTSLGQKASPQSVVFYQWQGFRVKPKLQGTQAVVLAPRGGSANAVAVACDDLTTGPQPADELEPVIYDAAGSTITFDKSGSVEIKTASGATALLDSDGNIWLVPKAGKNVKAGSFVNVELDQIATKADVQAAFNDVITHTHPIIMGAVAQSTELATPGACTVHGSPNCYAKRP
jgi:hypothetical protein